MLSRFLPQPPSLFLCTPLHTKTETTTVDLDVRGSANLLWSLRNANTTPNFLCGSRWARVQIPPKCRINNLQDLRVPAGNPPGCPHGLHLDLTQVSSREFPTSRLTQETRTLPQRALDIYCDQSNSQVRVGPTGLGNADHGLPMVTNRGT